MAAVTVCSDFGAQEKKICRCFYFFPNYLPWNDRLDEPQAGIKTAGRNISNLRYTNDTTLMAESEEELKNLLMRLKQKSEKSGLKHNI